MNRGRCRLPHSVTLVDAEGRNEGSHFAVISPSATTYKVLTFTGFGEMASIDQLASAKPDPRSRTPAKVSP